MLRHAFAPLLTADDISDAELRLIHSHIRERTGAVLPATFNAFVRARPAARPPSLPPCEPARQRHWAGFRSDRVLYAKRTRFLACFSPRIKDSFEGMC